MSDDLVKRLRDGDHFEKVMLAEQAADRIEELVEALEDLLQQVQQYGHTPECHAARAAIAKAKGEE